MLRTVLLTVFVVGCLVFFYRCADPSAFGDVSVELNPDLVGVLGGWARKHMPPMARAFSKGISRTARDAPVRLPNGTLTGFALETTDEFNVRVAGGVPVRIKQYPHQLSLQATGYGHFCGASLISANWVITAAHCVGFPISEYSLRAGSSNKDGGTRYAVKRIIQHPQYANDTFDYDVALLEVEGSIELGENVQPVKLATTELAADSMVHVTGWGATSEGGPASERLMRVSLPLVDRETCKSVYKSWFPITDRMICAGYAEGVKDSCKGDSGGPLTSKGVLYGIVSWGYGCARPNYFGVYTNVANLRDWIKQNSGV